MAESVVLMQSMQRLLACGSHFELIKADRLPLVTVVQIWPEPIDLGLFTDEVFLCEVIDESED